MGGAGKGIAAMVGACTIWGLSPLFYALLTHVPPLELLAWRCLWSLVFFLGLLTARRRLGDLAEPLASLPRAGMTLVAGLLIAANWLGFILAVSSGRTLESALGYFIFPLAAVALGRLVLGERISQLQWIAVWGAVGAVSLLTWGLGVPPWISIVLAVTFAFYGLLKTGLAIRPVVSVTAEMALLAPAALIWLVSQEGAFAHDPATLLLLMLSGPLTALPLVMFSHAARRVRLSTLGLVQYLNPSLQFLCAVLWFAEPFTLWHAIAFPVIWGALALYSASQIVQDRAARRSASSVATSGTTVTNP
ncbi:MAG: EamA family transporter RarD [Rubellimicrobium sp.]|nr:EamA family transporter RarD [Rubellimicrobium sp.]